MTPLSVILVVSKMGDVAEIINYRLIPDILTNIKKYITIKIHYILFINMCEYKYILIINTAYMYMSVYMCVYI